MEWDFLAQVLHTWSTISQMCVVWNRVPCLWLTIAVLEIKEKHEATKLCHYPTLFHLLKEFWNFHLMNQYLIYVLKFFESLRDLKPYFHIWKWSSWLFSACNWGLEAEFFKNTLSLPFKSETSVLKCYQKAPFVICSKMKTSPLKQLRSFTPCHFRSLITVLNRLA